MNMALSDDEFKAIEKTWSLVATDLQTHGIAFFTRFFNQHPENKEFFPYVRDVDNEELHNSEAMNRQALNVMKAVNGLMGILSDVNAVLDELAVVAELHKGLGIPAELFKTFKIPFLETLESGLGEEFTEDAMNGYTKICDLVIETVISKY
ncbi:cytoglobin-like [Tubulanus polymorphus]|uniref:cytoglobin-like n=1 Tax=Tubulanus polymorphus TaxID=672921 RepID=UPI003DA5F825